MIVLLCLFIFSATFIETQVLLIGTSNSTNSFSSFENILIKRKIFYDKFYTDKQESLKLLTENNTPKYSILIIPNSYYWWYNPYGNWQKILTAEQENMLNQYQNQYNIKRIECNIYPSLQNVQPKDSANPGCCSFENFFYFNENSNLKMSSIGIYHYPAQIANSSNITPFLFSDRGVIGTIVSNYQTQTTMQFYTAFGGWSSTSNYLATYSLNWAFGGQMPDNSGISLNNQELYIYAFIIMIFLV